MLGIIGKNNDKGLGTLTRDFIKNLNIDERIFIEDSRTSRDLKGHYVKDPLPLIDSLKCDTLFIMEMPLFAVFKRCRERGIKTILCVNYEFTPLNMVEEPDLYQCSSSLNFDEIKSPDKVLLPYPISVRESKPRHICKTFVHNAGTLGLGGANGTLELIEALKYTKAPFKMIVRSQVPIKCDDHRVELRIGSFPHDTLFDDGDVFVMPQKFRATSLPIQEALLSGMPVLSSNIKPFNEFVNYTFEVDGFKDDRLTRPIKVAKLNPVLIAKSLDKLYNKDIKNDSLQAIEIGKTFTWETLKDKYLDICNI